MAVNLLNPKKSIYLKIDSCSWICCHEDNILIRKKIDDIIFDVALYKCETDGKLQLIKKVEGDLCAPIYYCNDFDMQCDEYSV